MFYSGVVQKVNANPWKTKTLHSFTLRGTQGFFNTGEKALSLIEGQSVEFQAEQGKRAGNFDVDFNSIKVIQAVAGPSQPATSASNVAQRPGGAVRSAAIMSKDDYWQRREERDVETQKRIELQSCRNSAVALAAVVYDNAPSSLPVEDFVQEWTLKFLALNAGQIPVPSTQTQAPDGEWK